MGMAFTGITASAETIDWTAPQIVNTPILDVPTATLTTQFTTDDTRSLYFESYVLTDADVETPMGSMTINNTEYQLIGIMSYDASDTKHVKLEKSNTLVTLSQDQYCPGFDTWADFSSAVRKGGVFAAVGTENAGISEPKEIQLVEAPDPQKVSAVAELISMEEGDLYSDQAPQGVICGTIGTVRVTMQKQPGVSNYFAAALNSKGSKVVTGTDHDIHFYKDNPSSWGKWGFGSASMSEDQAVFVGPNGETITQTTDTITAEIKVVQAPAEVTSTNVAYVQGENIVIWFTASNNSYTANAPMQTIEIPFERSSIGKVFPQFVNKTKVSATTTYPGKNVRLAYASEGGFGKVKYNSYYKLTTKNSWNSFTGDTIKFGKTGAYDVRVLAQDSRGNKAEKRFVIKVKATPDELTNISTVSATSIKAGKNVLIYADAAGGKPLYKFSYYYKAENARSYRNVSDGYTTSDFEMIKLKKAGTYDVRVIARDRAGATAIKDFKITVR